MLGGGGLRKSKRGQFYLRHGAIKLGFEAGPETPHTENPELGRFEEAANESW